MRIQEGKSDVIRAADNTGIAPMDRTEISLIVADWNVDELTMVSRSLALLGYRSTVAHTAKQLMEFLRRDVFEMAVVAIELTWASQPILERLSRLPSLRCLVAIGPQGDSEMESLARLSGADAYLSRPITTETLAKALSLPLVSKQI